MRDKHQGRTFGAIEIEQQFEDVRAVDLGSLPSDDARRLAREVLHFASDLER